MAPYPGQNDGARRYSCERFAACRVWMVHEAEAVEDGLVVREESEGKYSYALCATRLPIRPWSNWLGCIGVLPIFLNL
jgi:hypothetical protein